MHSFQMYFEWHIQSKISSSVALHHVCHPFGMLIPWTNAVFGPVQPLVECNQEIRAASEYLVFVCSHIWYVWETRLYLWDNALFVLTAGRNSQRSDFFLISAVLSWVLIFDLEQAQKRSLIQKNSNYTIFFYFFLSFFWNEVQRIVHFGRYVCTVHRYKYMYLGDTETFSTAQVCVCVCAQICSVIIVCLYICPFSLLTKFSRLSNETKKPKTTTNDHHDNDNDNDNAHEKETRGKELFDHHDNIWSKIYHLPERYEKRFWNPKREPTPNSFTHRSSYIVSIEYRMKWIT